MSYWNSLSDLFFAMNNTEYVVLRNYEEYIHDITNLEHPDIDILCSDRQKMIDITKSQTRTSNKDDLIHRKLIIHGKTVDLDIRCIGDGYYDEIWERNILQNRVLYNDLFFIPNKEDYFYSLLYHVLIQKKEVSKDYVNKLQKMAKDIGLNSENVISIKTLENYMRSKRYYYTFPENAGTIFNLKEVDRKLIKFDCKKQFQRMIRRIKEIIE